MVASLLGGQQKWSMSLVHLTGQWGSPCSGNQGTCGQLQVKLLVNGSCASYGISELVHFGALFEKKWIPWWYSAEMCNKQCL